MTDNKLYLWKDIVVKFTQSFNVTSECVHLKTKLL